MKKERFKKSKSLYKRRAYRLHRIFVLLVMLLLMLICNIDRIAYLFHAENYIVYQASCKAQGYDQLVGIIPTVQVSFTNRQGDNKVLENSYITPIIYGYHHASINWKPLSSVTNLVKTKILTKLGKKESSDNEAIDTVEESSKATDTDTITIAVDKEKENAYIYLLPLWRCPINILAPIIMIFCLFPCKQLFVIKKKAKIKSNKKADPPKENK